MVINKDIQQYVNHMINLQMLYTILPYKYVITPL